MTYYFKREPESGLILVNIEIKKIARSINCS